MTNERETFYKAARWNGEEDDTSPNVIPMKRGPNCSHDMEPAIDENFQRCRYNCGRAVRV